MSLNLKNELSFNRLLELQTLVKKESALKELFIKTGNETKKNIDLQCMETYKEKMEVLNTLQRLNQEKPKTDKNPKKAASSQTENLKNHIFIEESNTYLNDLNLYIPFLLNTLWEEPKLVANILINSNIDDVKNYLAPLICNNFYENILSSNYIQDPLMYIIYILLNNEINNIEDIKNVDSFLNQTQCSYLLGQLIEKKDIKEFFKLILDNILEELGSHKFHFDIKKIEKNIFSKRISKNLTKSINNNERKKSEETTNLIKEEILTYFGTFNLIDDNKKNNDDIFNIIKESNDYKKFTTNYMSDISFNMIKQKIEEAKDETLKDYYNYLLSNANNDKKAYTQLSFIDSLAQSNNYEMNLIFYQQNFMKAIEFINKLFKNLNDNYRIVPYSIRCICTIINKLVMNKFPTANHIEKKLLISKFFFQIILIPVLLRPDINALINDYIITNNILHNVNIISNILLKFVSFQLYRNDKKSEGEIYSPFNIYFLEKIPEVFTFYEKISKVKLPNFINKLIKKEISIDEYQFNYFKENPDKALFYKSMLLNIDESDALIRNIFNNKEKLFPTNDDNKELKNKILKTLRKICNDNNNKMEKLLKHEDYTTIKKEIINEGIFSKKKEIIEEKKQNIQYFHSSELLFNDKYQKLFSLKQEYQYYHIKEIKEITNKELINKNNIIKAKNYICSILYNYRVLEKSDYNLDEINNTIDILNELKLFMKSSNFLIDGNFSSEWYISTLIECLQKLPEGYKKNDYELLFKELKEELTESIKEYNFEYMGYFIDKMKYSKRNKLNVKTTKNIYMDIELNKRANEIIENENININLFYKFDDKKREFSIYKEAMRDKKIDFLNSFSFKESNRGKLCKTIEEFTKYFPNLNKRLSLEKQTFGENEIGLFELEKQIELQKNLNIFFDIVRGCIQNNAKEEENLEIINNKIYDYVMSKIYNRIYPIRMHPFDEQIFKNECKVSWIEPENINNSLKDFDLDLILPDINKYFNLIRTEKSPRKKINNLKNIFDSLSSLIVIKKGQISIAVDDILPVLTYCTIKCKSKWIFTDCQYMELFLEEKEKNGNKDFLLTQLKTNYNFIKDINVNSLYNIDEEEYNKKTQLTTSEDNN